MLGVRGGSWGSVLPPGPTQRPLGNLARFVADPMALFWDAAAEYGPTFSLQLAGQPTWVCVGDPLQIERVQQAPGASNERDEPMRGDRLLPGLAWARDQAIGDATSELTETAWRHVDVAVGGLRADQRIRASELLLGIFAPIVVDALVPDDPGGARRLLALVLESGRAATGGSRVRGAGERLVGFVGAPRLRRALGERLGQARTLGLADDVDALVELVRDLVEGCALTLAWTLWLLSTHRVWRERVIEEARDATLGSRTCEAVIDETLRLRPVVLARIRRLALPLVLGEWSLPPDTWVLATQVVAHLRGDVWESAFEFRPQRFGSATRPSPGVFFPLGGARSESLARASMCAVLLRLLARVDLHVAAAANPRPALCGSVIGPSDGVPLVIERVHLTSWAR